MTSTRRGSRRSRPSADRTPSRPHRRHAHNPGRRAPGRRVPGGRAAGRPPHRGREHASPLGPRVRQRRLPRRRHRRPARLSATHRGRSCRGATSRCSCRPRGVPAADVTFGTGSPTSTRARPCTSSTRPGTARTPVVSLARGPAPSGSDTVEWPLPLRCSGRHRRSGYAPYGSSSSCPWTSSCPATARRWAGRSSTPTSATSAGCTKSVATRRPPASAARRARSAGGARFLGDDVLVDEVYEAAHRDNLLWAWDEV